jgi:hypothetical protein
VSHIALEDCLHMVWCAFLLQLAVVSGMLDMTRQCDIVTSVLCKYTVRQPTLSLTPDMTLRGVMLFVLHTV